MRALWILALVASAHADTRVLVVETRGAPALPSLSSQIMVHADAVVTTRAEPEADPETYAERASQLVAAGEAALVIWMAPVEGGVLVFAAGARAGRALTELVRVDLSIGVAEIERTIALKIAGLLDVVQAPEPVAVALAAPLEPAAPRGREWRIEVDGLVAYETHERAADGRAALAGGLAWRRGPWVVAPLIGGYWQPSGTIERAAGRVSLVEVGGTLGIEGGRDLGPVELFGRVRAVGAGIGARGISTDGRRGRATVFAPYAGLELGIRRVVSTNVRFGILGGCDFALIRRELVIDDDTIVDLGALRLHVGLAMTVSL